LPFFSLSFSQRYRIEHAHANFGRTVSGPVFTFKQLHELVHDLTEAEDAAFRQLLQQRRSENLRILYETLRAHSQVERSAYRDKLPPRLYGALRVWQVRLRDLIYDFLAKGPYEHGPLFWLFGTWLLIRRGLWGPARMQVGELLDTYAALPEEMALAHQRAKMLSYHFDRGDAAPAPDFQQLRRHIAHELEAMQTAMQFTLAEQHMAAQIYTNVLDSPEKIRDWQNKLEALKTHYLTVQRDEQKKRWVELSEAMAQIVLLDKLRTLNKAAEADIIEKRCLLLQKVQQIVDRLTQVISSSVDVETAIDVMSAYFNAAIFLMDERRYAEALRVVTKEYTFWRSIRPHLTPMRREGVESLHLIGITSIAGETMNITYPVPALPKSFRELHRRRFMVHQKIGRIQAVLYKAAHAYVMGDYRTALQWARRGILDELVVMPSWRGQTLLMIWVCVLFEQGRRPELHALMTQRINRWLSGSQAVPEAAILRFIAANDYHCPSRDALQGVDALYQTLYENALFISRHRPEVRWYPYFDYLSWAEMLRDGSPYRRVLERKRAAAGIPDMASIMADEGIYEPAPRAARKGVAG